MEFYQLETLLAIVKNGSFSRAGEELHLTQPTITAHILALENELGQQLLVRSRKGVRLTQAGQTVYDYACTALHKRDELLQEFTATENRSVHLRIAASSIPAQYILPELLAAFRNRYPAAHFDVRFCDSAGVLQALHQEQVDIGMSGSLFMDKECEYISIAKDRLVVITPNDQAHMQLDPTQPFPKELLITEPMIARESGSGTRKEFEDYLHHEGFSEKPNIVAVMADSLAIKNAVVSGMGIAVLSERAVDDYAKNGYILTFALENFADRDLYLMHLKKNKLMGAAKEFYDFILKQGK